MYYKLSQQLFLARLLPTDGEQSGQPAGLRQPLAGGPGCSISAWWRPTPIHREEIGRTLEALLRCESYWFVGSYAVCHLFNEA